MTDLFGIASDRLKRNAHSDWTPPTLPAPEPAPEPEPEPEPYSFDELSRVGHDYREAEIALDTVKTRRLYEIHRANIHPRGPTYSQMAGALGVSVARIGQLVADARRLNEKG